MNQRQLKKFQKKCNHKKYVSFRRIMCVCDVQELCLQLQQNDPSFFGTALKYITIFVKVPKSFKYNLNAMKIKYDVEPRKFRGCIMFVVGSEIYPRGYKIRKLE